MAKLEKITDRDFDGLLHSIEEGILEGSISASLEDSSDFQSGDARCSEKITDRDFDGLLHSIEEGILEGSISASLEDSSDFQSGDARCSVRVFERYSYMGGNRVSLSVTLFQSGNEPGGFQ